MKIILAVILAVAICHVQAKTKIDGGGPIPATDKKSTVAIFSYTGTNIDHICSGAFIHPEWVLTSATCVKMVEKYDMRVTTGDIPVAQVVNTFEGAYLIKNKIAHPSFNAISLLNDIGLIQIENRMEGTERSLKLLQVATDVTNTLATVRGYGENTVPTDKYTQKEKNNIIIVDNKNCVLKDIVMTNKICTNSPGACKGDEGGPLISKNTGALVGIISLKEQHLEFCGMAEILPFTPYTNVWPFKQWIKDTTKLNL